MVIGPRARFCRRGLGDVTVSENRGHFRIEDAVRVTCADQTVDASDPGSDQPTIAGTLKCNGADPVRYTLTFAALGPNLLGFHLAVDDTNINLIDKSDKRYIM